MGQQLFYAPSVFSYFSPFARDSGGLIAPEFQIYTTQTAANRSDTLNAAIYGTLDAGTQLGISHLRAEGRNAARLIDYISYAFFSATACRRACRTRSTAGG